MTKETHFRRLEAMYQASPIFQLFPADITISEGEATITLPLQASFFHSAGAAHGCTYFKLLDDAAFFAANSLETEVFVLTTAFTTYLTRPISEGAMTVVGRVANANKSQFIAESIAYNDEGKEIARGNGIFVRGKLPLTHAAGYDEPL